MKNFRPAFLKEANEGDRKLSDERKPSMSEAERVEAQHEFVSRLLNSAGARSKVEATPTTKEQVENAMAKVAAVVTKKRSPVEGPAELRLVHMFGFRAAKIKRAKARKVMK